MPAGSKIKFIAVGIVLVMALAGTVWSIQYYQSKKSSAESILTGKEKGTSGAPVKIIEFSDFECGACQKSQPILEDLLKRYEGKVQLIYKHFPLPGHKWSGAVHQAAECANRKGKFWHYHDLLYANQQTWAKLPNITEPLLLFARTAGVSLDEFASCLTDEKVRETVFADLQEGKALSIMSTPTFIIGSERLVGPVELQNRGPAAIEKALAESQNPKTS